MAYPPLSLASFNFGELFSALLPLLIAAVVLGFIFRGIREKMEDLSLSFSAVICVLLIYVPALLAAIYLPDLFGSIITSLPFLTVSGQDVILFSFTESVPAEICVQILSVLILAFAANLSVGIVPAGKKLLSHIFLLLMTLGLTYGIYSGIMWIFRSFLPGVMTSYAPMILLVVLAVFLFIGVLRFLLGLVLTIANPILGGIYAFFFSSKVGKLLSKSVLSTIILTVLCFCLARFVIPQFTLSDSLMQFLLPVLAVLAVLRLILTKE